MQVARDVGTLWATLQPPSDCSPAQREGLLLEVATASAAAHATWQSEQDSVVQVASTIPHVLWPRSQFVVLCPLYSHLLKPLL